MENYDTKPTEKEKKKKNPPHMHKARAMRIVCDEFLLHLIIHY